MKKVSGKCVECGRLFARRSNLKAHLMNVHKLPYAEAGRASKMNVHDVQDK